MAAGETLHLRIEQKFSVAENICSLSLVSPAGGDLPDFEAGAHLDVHLPHGLVRQYSLCGDPRNRREYLLGVLRDPASRGGSIDVHETLQAGDLVRVSLPKNHFPLDESAPSSVLFAGGIGITPILAMARRLAAIGRPYTLDYCTRTRAAAAFLDTLLSEPFAPNVRFHVDDGAPEQRLDPAAVIGGAAPGSHFYVCGPTGFMEWVLAACSAAGIENNRVHREYFTNAAVDEDGDAFTLILQRSDLTFRIPGDRTILAVLQESGIDVPTSCEQGVCGTCLTPVLDGIPDHRDVYLTDAEHAANDQMTPCCSRSKTGVLVLDL